MEGLVAFVHATATKPFAGCTCALHPELPARYRQLDRNEDSMHPGEVSA
jgi:hypothetical protein